MLDDPPEFLDQFDLVYLTVSVPPGQGYADVLGADLDGWLDTTVLPFQLNTGQTIILGLELGGTAQADLYTQALAAVDEREWIGGFVARGYSPAAALQDESFSINGKPAAGILARWYAAWVDK
jgi:hypothetical protein